MYKTFKMWEEDHKRFKQQSAANNRQMIEEFSALVNNRDERMIDGKKYRVVPMDSDSMTMCGSVRKAKMNRSNRVGRDG
jgi:chlorite dismutase